MNPRVLVAALCGALVALALVATAGAGERNVGSRPDSWAQPVQVEGVRNLYRVSDDLYRSAQPKAEGMKGLSALGVKTIVSVRFFHTGRRSVDDMGPTFERIAIKPWYPKEKQVVRFLQIVTDPERTPVLLHCYKGSDRTGMLSAMYRIVVQGWSKEAAIEEMKLGGYGFNAIWGNLVSWIEKADIERIRGLVYPSNQASREPCGRYAAPSAITSPRFISPAVETWPISPPAERYESRAEPAEPSRFVA